MAWKSYFIQAFLSAMLLTRPEIKLIMPWAFFSGIILAEHGNWDRFIYKKYKLLIDFIWNFFWKVFGVSFMIASETSFLDLQTIIIFNFFDFS